MKFELRIKNVIEEKAFKKSSVNRREFCLGLSVLKAVQTTGVNSWSAVKTGLISSTLLKFEISIYNSSIGPILRIFKMYLSSVAQPEAVIKGIDK